MTPPDRLVHSILSIHGPETAERLLRQAGYRTSVSRLKKLRDRMIKSGSAVKLAGGGAKRGAHDHIEARQVIANTAQLADRINALYHRVARERGCSPEAAMLMLNYSRAQLEKMAA